MKNATRRRWQRRADPALQEQIKNMTKDIKAQIYKNKNKIWQERIEKLNIKDNTLYKTAKLLRKSKTPAPVGNLITNNTTAITDKQKADTLARFYSDVHNLQLDNRPLTQKQKEINQIAELIQKTIYKNPKQYDRDNLASPEEIRNIIKYLPNNKAPGPDNIPNKVIKNLSKKALVQLHYIINSIIKLQHFPKQWKIATVVPIPKQNKKVVNERLNRYGEKLNLTRQEQFGFRPGHDTTQQVTRIITDIITNFNKQKLTSIQNSNIHNQINPIIPNRQSF
jgi:hypothetical protein